MALDEQLAALCKEHDLVSLSVDMFRDHGRSWAHVSVQWIDEVKPHSRGIATSDHGVSIRDGIQQAIERMNAERFKPASVSELEAA